MRRILSRRKLDELRAACRRALSLETKKVLICGGTGCVAGGSLNIYARLKELLEERTSPSPLSWRTSPTANPWA